jgi:hypothetical protein
MGNAAARFRWRWLHDLSPEGKPRIDSYMIRDPSGLN